MPIPVSRISMKNRRIVLPGNDRYLASIISKFESIGKEVNEDIVERILVGIKVEVLRNVNLNGEGFFHRG